MGDDDSVDMMIRKNDNSWFIEEHIDPDSRNCWVGETLDGLEDSHYTHVEPAWLVKLDAPFECKG